MIRSGISSEVRGRDHGEPLLTCKALGAGPGEQNVLAVLHHSRAATIGFLMRRTAATPPARSVARP